MVLPAAFVHCWESLMLNPIVMPRYLTHYTLSTLTPFISSSNFWFNVPTCRMRHLLTLKGISHLSDHSQIVFRSTRRLTCHGHRLPSFLFSYRWQILIWIYWVRRQCHLCSLWTGLVQEQSIVELRSWLVPNPMQCHWRHHCCSCPLPPSLPPSLPTLLPTQRSATCDIHMDT